LTIMVGKQSVRKEPRRLRPNLSRTTTYFTPVHT
jgi:hypothetical protein